MRRDSRVRSWCGNPERGSVVRAACQELPEGKGTPAPALDGAVARDASRSAAAAFAVTSAGVAVADVMDRICNEVDAGWGGGVRWSRRSGACRRGGGARALGRITLTG